MRWLLVVSLVIPSHADANGDARGLWHTSAEYGTQGSKSEEAPVVSGRRGVKKHLHSGDEPCFAGRKLELWS